MTKYIIQRTRKDDEGDIIKVQTKYNEFTTEEVIEKIEGGEDSFVVEDYDGEIPVMVVERQGKKYIRTFKNGKETDNLDNLPDF